MADPNLFGLDFPVFSNFVAAIVGVPTFAYGWYVVGRRRGSTADKKLIASLQKDNAYFADRFNGLERVVGDAQDFWLKSPAPETFASQQAALQNSVPIITFLNFKGGVGKTTICANLAGYFAERGKRVLLIDCDYQGSLSDTVLSHARVEKFATNSNLLLQKNHEPSALRSVAERLSSIDSRLWIYPSFYGYSRTEISMMFRWLIGQDEEIRFNMSQYLQSGPFKETEETRFDLVLIDAPPRLLTGVVNALAASTHVIIPTILDGQSYNATLNTVAAIAEFKQKLNPNLQVLGVVPSMVSASTGYNALEDHFRQSFERDIPEMYGGIVPVLSNYPILRRQELAKAGGSEIVFKTSSNTQSVNAVRDMFRELGDYVYDHVKWRKHNSAAEVYTLPGQDKRRAAL